MTLFKNKGSITLLLSTAVFELQYNSGVLRRPEARKRRLFSSERRPINKGCGQLLSLITTKFKGVATTCL